MDFIKGKRVIITGPTSGIGTEIAMGLGALRAELVLGCRDVRRGEQTAAEVSRRTGVTGITVMYVDMSSQQSIRDFARHYRERYSRLDVLINNAGISQGSRPRANSLDGVEFTFATNVLVEVESGRCPMRGLRPEGRVYDATHCGFARHAHGVNG